METKVIQLNSANFDTFLKDSSKPVLVDFWAAWCGPCRMLGPVLDEVAAENAENIIVAKVNVDENPEIASRFGIRGIPAVKIFKESKEVYEAVGAHPKEFWERAVQEVQ